MYRSYLFAIGFALVLLMTNRFGGSPNFSNLIAVVIEPVMAAEGTAIRKSVSFFNIILSLRDLARENAGLNKRNHELEAEISRLREVEHENAILRDELKFSKESKTDYIPAQLLGQTNTGIIKDLIINKGSKEGVVSDSAVIAHGYLVGVIKSVEINQSTVRLVTHPRSMIPVITQDSRAHGQLRGGIGGLIITDLLIDQPTSPGETVVTSGLGGSLPSGIPIGTLIEATARSGDITKRATLTFPVDLSRLEMVFIRHKQ